MPKFLNQIYMVGFENNAKIPNFIFAITILQG